MPFRFRILLSARYQNIVAEYLQPGAGFDEYGQPH